jgi:type IX secretion system PorP/SprF family membrane protein
MIRMKKTIIFCFFLLASFFSANAQQDPQYSQYMFNSLVINPAYAGYKEVLNAGVLNRDQWLNIAGAPKTQSIILDGSFGDNKKFGFALSVVNDKLGLQGQTTAYLNYAYRLQVGANSRLALGLGLGVGQYTLNGGGAITDDPNDPSFSYGKSSFIVPDARVGVHYSNNKFYAALSTTNLFSRAIDYSNATKNIVARQGRHLFLTAGYLLYVNDFLKFKPSFLIKEDTKGPTNLDINNFILLGEKLWLGVSYRTSVNLLNKSGVVGAVKAPDAIVGLVELFAGKGWRLGYAYDHTISSLQGNAGATHELSLGLSLGGKRDVKILSPRYF